MPDAPPPPIALSVADDLPVGVWAARVPSGELLYANRMFTEIMGMGARDDVGVGEYAVPYSIHDREGALYPEDRLPFVRAMREQQIVTVDDIVIHRPDGERVDIRAQARPVFDGAGAMTHVVIAFMDISREVAAERARDGFLALAAHELRTPLSTLQLRVHILGKLVSERAELLGGPISKGLQVCERQAHRLAKLAEELLDVSRIRSGRFQPELEQVDLVQLVRDAVTTCQELDLSRGTEISFEAEGTLEARVDPRRLEHAVVNLISNAVKYGLERPVRVRVGRVESRALISVADQGIGIADGDLARIFEPFERAVPTRNYGGLGLGLWIVRQSVESLGGRVLVESRLAHGSTFAIELPL